MIKTVLFDLDGTLLPMDQEVFTKDYFKRLATKLAPLGYEPDKLISAVWAGTKAMVKNNGSCTNEEAFWKQFSQIWGEKVLEDKPVFNEFYQIDFQDVASVCGCNPQAKEIVSELKARGYRVALATNPIFPAVATESRIRWAGLQPDDFELYTTYENTSFSKPNPDYYREVLKRLECRPEECLMVGNDADEDMIAETLGIKVFLLTDCLINNSGKDLSKYAKGSFSDLLQYLLNSDTAL